MEKRKVKISITKSGGCASKNTLKYRLTMPNSWAQKMNISEENQYLNIYNEKNFFIASNNDKIERLNIEMQKHNKDLNQIIDFTLEKLNDVGTIKIVDLAKIFEKCKIDDFENALHSINLCVEDTYTRIFYQMHPNNDDELNNFLNNISEIYLDIAYDIMQGTLEYWDSNLSDEESGKLYEENENFREDKEKEVWEAILLKANF